MSPPIPPAGLFAVGWGHAGQILAPPPVAPAGEEATVVATGAGRVRLRRTVASAEPGLLGLAHAGGYARAGTVDGGDATTVTRPYLSLAGESPRPGAARVDGYACPPDPADAFAFPVDEVAVPGPLGRYPAWQALPTGRRRGTWVVFVHGRGGTRAEAFRALPTVRRLGLPALCVTYRNDAGAPRSPEGMYGLGWTEWQDVQAATDHARRHGARAVVLFGYSMGGAIVAAYLARSPDAHRVRGAVLDSPVLDWEATITHSTRERRLPGSLTPLAMSVARLRARVPWGRLDQVARAGEWSTPVLLAHGTADPSVPVATSDAFAAARPDLVEYLRVPGAGHARAWNVDPAGYERALRRFLLGLRP